MMNLNNEQREQVRLCLLRYGAQEVSIGLARSYLQSEGFRGLTSDEVASEMQYLEDKGLVVAVRKLVSPENARWRRTAAGTDYLAEQGN